MVYFVPTDNISEATIESSENLLSELRPLWEQGASNQGYQPSGHSRRSTLPCTRVCRRSRRWSKKIRSAAHLVLLQAVAMWIRFAKIGLFSSDWSSASRPSGHALPKFVVASLIPFGYWLGFLMIRGRMTCKHRQHTTPSVDLTEVQVVDICISMMSVCSTNMQYSVLLFQARYIKQQPRIIPPAWMRINTCK